MEVFRNNGVLEISEIDPFLAELLRQIPVSTNPESVPAAEQRLFSPPAGPDEKELCAEWKVYVEPELRRLFRTATETVESDLRQLGENEKPFANSTLRIPRSIPKPGSTRSTRRGSPSPPSMTSRRRNFVTIIARRSVPAVT